MKTVVSTVRDIRSGALSATENTDETLRRMSQDSFNAFHEIWSDEAGAASSTVQTAAIAYGMMKTKEVVLADIIRMEKRFVL